MRLQRTTNGMCVILGVTFKLATSSALETIWQSEDGRIRFGRRMTRRSFWASIDKMNLNKNFRTEHAAVKDAIAHRDVPALYNKLKEMV